MAEETANTTTAVNPTGNVATAPVAPWYGTNADPALVGYLQNRGWDKLDPAAAALAAAQAHREASQFLGVPPEQLLRLPKDASDEAAWKTVYQRLGAPADPKEYAFDGVDFGDPDLTADFTGVLRSSASKYGLTKEAAAGLAADLFKWIEGKGAAEDAEATAAREAAMTALKQSWGNNYAANEFIANQAVAKLDQMMGGDGRLAKAVKALVEGGHAHLNDAMEMFRVIGQGLGEDKFVSGTGVGGGVGGAMTREQALQRRYELTGIPANGGPMGKPDQEFIARLNRGDAAAKREWAALTAIIAGVPQ